MILARLSRAIRQQNWFAVALEFIIVIAGVVMGFQVTAWNEARTDRLRESVILTNLGGDFRTLVTDIDRIIERTFEISRNVTIVVETIDTGVVPEDRIDQFETGLIALVWAVPPPQSPSTLQELVSSGGLSRLTDPALREAMAQFMEQREAVHGMASLLVEARFSNAQRMTLPIVLAPGSAADLEVAFESGAFLDLQSYRAAQGIGSTLESYDLQALRAEPALRQMYAGSRDINDAYISWLVVLRESAQAVVDQLEGPEPAP